MEARVRVAVKTPTPEQVQGPFYPVVKPQDQDADLTAIRGKAGKAQGQVLYLAGQVISTRGEPAPEVRVEIWQANTHGRYTHPNDSNPAPIDPSFQGYGVATTDAQGRYRFKTVKPGAYPVGEGWTRPPHIHFLLTSRMSKLATQMYFPEEPLNEKDFLFKSTPDNRLLLAVLGTPAGEMEPDALTATWDIVLA